VPSQPASARPPETQDPVDKFGPRTKDEESEDVSAGALTNPAEIVEGGGVAKVEYGSLGSLRAHNRRRVLDALRHRGTASRAELARVTGLSRSTVSSLVGELQHSGLVVESTRAGNGGSVGGSQGRPPVLLTLDRRAGAVVGIDFGHDDVRVAVAALSRTVLAERVADIDVDHSGIQALDLAARLVEEALEEASIPKDRVLAAGMGVSGPVDH
jgi:DNA-binding transcriptional ArsR family regulator